MKITGSTSITGYGNILSGYYSIPASGGNRPKLFEFSSPIFGMENFSPPYDAILPNPNSYTGNIYLAVGRRIKSTTDTIRSNISGALYYYNVPELIGTCHGIGRNADTYYKGHNFYNAFYPAGYFHPPYGETPSLFKLNQDEYDALNVGSCSPLSITEYNEQFGIISRVTPSAKLATDTLTPGTLKQIMSLKESCPEGTIAVPSYYEEVQAKLIPGTASSLTAPTHYNHHATPTSLDNYENWVDSRYVYTADAENLVNKIQFGADLRPLPNYDSGDTNHSRLNNSLCYAQLFETDMLVGKLSNGVQKLDSPDILWGSPGSQTSAAGQEPWHYWHFIFRENAETIPFESDFNEVREGSIFRTMNEGTRMFRPVLSSSEMYWQNRQCPDSVDFLPWNMGASIYACPSEHFDIPYYASIKKFGFYGTRFLSSCKKLNLEHTWNGVPNVLEVAAQAGPLDLAMPEVEPEGIDGGGTKSFSAYDSLLRLAGSEERYSNMYALNKGFFIWANSGCIFADVIWQGLSTRYNGIGSLLSGLISQFQGVYQGGLSSFISGEPRIVLKNGSTSTEFSVLDSGRYSDLLFTNDAYTKFKEQLETVISGNEGLFQWKQLEDKYAYYISNCNGGLNETFYKTILSGREKRMRTRYFENIIRGNPIDLFPLNHVTFATDTASSYLESTGWGRKSSSFGKSSNLPPIQRRYFEGAYGHESMTTGLTEIVNKLSIANNTSFYPGFFNQYNFGQEIPKAEYVAVLSGYIRDSVGRKYSPSGWLAIGYNEVGALSKNFSCFTPIFTQQPLSKVFCKIGQHPTLRVNAVDYHSIPEDKISYKYPEIIYWAYKLKICNGSLKNNYPLKYSWFRVPKTSATYFASTADFSVANFASSTGSWCALEGDGKTTCTIIHPKECVPTYANKSEDAYTYIQGVKMNTDDNYYYYCMVQGRFGIRISEPAELVVEDWIRFDVSQKNGMNALGQVSMKFIVNDIYGQDNYITFTSDASPAYQGYQLDKYAIPESVVEQKVPPPNAGYGDVSASRFVGPYGYVGATRSYAPDTLKDTRGLRETWGRMVDYGSLIALSKKLSQREGNLLYGYQHLPQCENYKMSNGKKGIRVEAYVNDYKVTHWTLPQQAVATSDSTAGMSWSKINGIGSLYPPATNPSEIVSQNMAIGHWQWGNNLGAIKRFGYLSKPKDNDLVLVGKGATNGAMIDPMTLKAIKTRFIKPDTLAGTNCGYTKYGLGRNMLYYIEAFDRFYLICDPIKKKNVQNLSFMCPGLRFTNSAIQYFWLGQPHNTYVERRPMYGPYAFQWRTARHNRDRNGNGISRGFYSMNYGLRYELMYDAPAIYGLYVKKDASSAYKSQVLSIKALRRKVFNGNPADLRGLWFGEAGSEGTSRQYGSSTFSCDGEHWGYNKDMCEYVYAAKVFANNPDFKAYSCPEDRLKKGECFDPCLSLRYAQGFFPGGKSQNLFGYNNTVSTNLPTPRNIRLVPYANMQGSNLITTDENAIDDNKTFFRSPINTPHARVWRGLMEIKGYYTNRKTENVVGVSPCQDGGADHCNYITPTIHLDMTSTLIGATTAFNASVKAAAESYSSSTPSYD